MTPEALRSLIARGESLNVELKGEERTSLSDRDLVEAAVCLANRAEEQAGWILIGVEDDGRLTGARPRPASGQTDPARVAALIAARTRPPLRARVELVELDGLHVLAIEVPRVRQPVATADGRFLRRAVGGDGRLACLPMDVFDMESMQSDRGLLDPSAQIVHGAGWDDLDPLEVERFRRSIRERRGRSDESLLELSDLELAKALGVVDANSAVRGIDTIFYEQLRNGRPAPSYDRTDSAGVVVVLAGGAANLDLARLLVQEAQGGRVLGLDELLILNALQQERSLTINAAARLTQKPVSDTRAALRRLVEAGLVEDRGQRKGCTWHLAAAVYRTLGDKAAYVRRRGFEPLQQEQMVLHYVEKHGRITRREATELCRLSGAQAYRLLARLVGSGSLVRHGERGRGVAYGKGTE